MNENIFEVQYDVTKKSKFKRLYEKYKILVITLLTTLIILIISLSGVGLAAGKIRSAAIASEVKMIAKIKKVTFNFTRFFINF